VSRAAGVVVRNNTLVDPLRYTARANGTGAAVPWQAVFVANSSDVAVDGNTLDEAAPGVCRPDAATGSRVLGLGGVNANVTLDGRPVDKALGAFGRALYPNPSSPGSPTASGGGLAIHEYVRPGWTFHGKGIWWLRTASVKENEPLFGRGSPRPQALPQLVMSSVIGSSNFGRRSLDRDLELSVLLETTDPTLVSALAEERDRLWGMEVPPRHAASDTSRPGLGTPSREPPPTRVESAANTAGATPAATAAATTIDASSTKLVRAVGGHLPRAAYPGADVWGAGSTRVLTGRLLDWQQGWWIRWAQRAIASLL
jgi:phosphatidylserine/phosphatidylglycerophosphate/cardiolipin synthase-like enzyme